MQVLAGAPDEPVLSIQNLDAIFGKKFQYGSEAIRFHYCNLFGSHANEAFRREV